MSTTAQTIITNALRTVGAVADSQQPDPDSLKMAFEKLNDMLDSWATESLFAYATAEYTYQLPPGAQTVTIGPTGNIKAATPSRIEGGFVRSGGVDYPFGVVDYADYSAIAMKGLNAPYPTVAYYDGNGLLTFYPIPSGGELHVPILLRLAEFATLTTQYTLPEGYRKALSYSLAEELAPDFGRTLAAVTVRTAASARRSIKRANHRVPTLNEPFFRGFNPVVLGGEAAPIYGGGNASSL